ncbi:DUF6798 domain-containing protein [Tautonia sociabilis]|uniref:DUF6798 domain-containing protein n=1 Tax=Tautonia sociabilis TaxID=2080755 RepID=A0A432MQE1_9BACT|nr:DUF6798 domain-containing protein [Tautonia sociabilis]RUL89218.1 hypothetical protein TsocGM_03635 [Tautonia sociabilis]
MPAGSGSPRPAPTWLAFVLLFGASLSLQGYRCLDGDQAYRLPLLLHSQTPSLYADDPFVRAFDAFNPHRGYLALLDYPSRLVGLPAALFLLYAITFAITCVGLRRLAEASWPGWGGWAGVLTVALVLLADAGNIGTNHLFEPMLLDRLIGFGLGWVALSGFVRGESGLLGAGLIGLAGLVHPSVGMQLGLLLGAGGTAGLFWPGRLGVSRARAAIGLGALAAALVPTVLLQAPQKAALFDGLDPETFRLLSFRVQGPQHMLPHLWRGMQWLSWFGYVLLAGLTLASEGRPLSAPRLRLATLLGVLLLGLGTAWVAIEVIEDPRITIFQPFRMATIARGICLVVISGRVLRLGQAGGRPGTLRAILLAAGLGSDGSMVVAVLAELAWTLGERLRSARLGAFAGAPVLAAGLAYLFRHDPDGGHLPLLAGIVLGIVLERARSRWTFPGWTLGRAVRLSALAFAVPALAMIAAIAPPSGPGWLRSAREALISRCRFGESPIDDVERLALWARSHTPPDARFIGPPGPKTFRLWSRRALAFNRAGSPYDASGLADWARRFADHVGFDGDPASFARSYLDDRHALERRYQQMSDADRAALARRQGAGYVLAAAPPDEQAPEAGSPLELLRVDGRYAIYRVRGMPDVLADRSQTEGDLRRSR